MKNESSFVSGTLIEMSEVFSGKIFIKQNDIKKLLTCAIENKKEEIFTEIAFTGKYLSGLTRVLKSAPGIPEIESLDSIKKDLSENYEKFINSVKILISEEKEQTKKYFGEEYFQLNPRSFENLNLLAGDFEKIKVYLNHLKRKATKNNL